VAKQISPPDFKPDFLYQYLLKFQFQYHFWIPQGILRSKLPKILNFDEIFKELWAKNQRQPKFINTKSIDGTFHGKCLTKNWKKKKLSESFITPSHSINMRYDSFWSIQIDKKKYPFLGNFLIFVIFQKGMNGHTVKSPIYRFGVFEFWFSLVFCS